MNAFPSRLEGLWSHSYGQHGAVLRYLLVFRFCFTFVAFFLKWISNALFGATEVAPANSLYIANDLIQAVEERQHG